MSEGAATVDGMSEYEELSTVAEQIVRDLWSHMDAMRWDDVGALLAEDAVIRFPDSGRVITNRADFVAFNAAYPGRSRCQLKRLVSAQATEDGVSLVVAEVQVDNDQSGRFWCAGFYQVTGGLVVGAVEYWMQEKRLGTSD